MSCCNVCSRNLITGLTYVASPMVNISGTCKLREKLKSVSYSVVMFSPPPVMSIKFRNPKGTYEISYIEGI
jgi:hypothetical protein